jgi:hypothetical protein
MSGDSGGGWDFFVSYAQADQAWAEWIAWMLEEDGYRILIQAWDFVPGSNWAAGMQAGARDAARTLAVLSQAYLDSVYGSAEWQAAWVSDPMGADRRLVTVRVADCTRPGLLEGVTGFDLFGLSEAQARDRLREGISAAVAGRAKPSASPGFPGGGSVVPGKPRFPGAVPPMPTLMLSGEELRSCLRELEVPEADVSDIIEWIERCVARSIHPLPARPYERLSIPFSGASPLQRRVADFLHDLLSFIQSERIFAADAYLSRAKLARYFRVYGQAMEEAGDWPDMGRQGSDHRKLIALYRHLSSRGLVVSAPILQLLGRPLPPDPDTIIYFTGEFTLRPDREVLDRFPGLQELIDRPEMGGLDGMAYRIFSAKDPFFYPMVRFTGNFWDREASIVMSRKHLRVDSSTSTAFVDALRGRPMAVTGLGTVDESPELHALVLRMSLPTHWQ